MRKNVNVTYNEDSINIPNTHFHNDIEIIFIDEGSSTFLIEDKEIFAEKNSMVIISNLENHSMSINDYPYKRYIIKIKRLEKISILPSEIYIKLFQNRPRNYPYVFKFDKLTANKIRVILKSILENYKESIFYFEYEQLLINQLMIIAFRSNKFFFTKKDTDLEKTIFRIQDFINTNYMIDINLNYIEDKFFINKYEVSRNFKKITGYNFKTYLILVRISAAKDLLVNSNLSIAEISNKVGYSSESLFIRMFKKYENITPTKFRIQYKY